MTNGYTIPVNGLASGRTEFGWSVGKEFFEEFGNTEVLDADLSVRATAEKSGTRINVDCDMEGVLTVQCDRCLADLQIRIAPHVRLSVRHEGAGNAEEVGREVISLAPDEAVLDMSQIIYDYACLALPMHRVHEVGKCDGSVIGHIGIAVQSDMNPDEEKESPFAVLKKMLD